MREHRVHCVFTNLKGMTRRMASGNNFVPRVLDMLMDLLLETREHSLQVGGRPQKSLAGHQRILVAIKRHDAEATYGAMLRHVQDVQKIVRSSF